MSFEINWDKLTEDNDINEAIKAFLDSQFKSIELPSYISDLSVTDFSLGDTPPQVTIRHIGDPLESFYEEDGQFTPARPPMNNYHSSDDDEDDDDKVVPDIGGLSIIAEDSNLNNSIIEHTEVPLRVSSPPVTNSPLNRSRTSSDPILMFIGSSGVNYMQNYNTNNMVGLVKLNSDAHSRNSSTTNLHGSGRDTPLDILTSNDYKYKISKQPAPDRSQNDIQFVVEVNYFGNLQMEVTVNLLVNYPSPNFISLPIKLHITDLVVHSIAAIAYLKNGVYFSFLCDVNDTNADYFAGASEGSSSMAAGGNFVDYLNGPNMRERIDIIKKVKIESEIGEVENNVLRNVGKVEKFLTEQLRKILRDEIAWPSWVCFDLNDDSSDSE